MAVDLVCIITSFHASVGCATHVVAPIAMVSAMVILLVVDCCDISSGFLKLIMETMDVLRSSSTIAVRETLVNVFPIIPVDVSVACAIASMASI